MTTVGGLLLDERGVEALLDQVKRVVGPSVAATLVSTDLWPYLEYATPRGNVLDYADRLNVTYLREKLGRVAPVPLRNTGDDTDPILPAARAYLQQDCARAALLSQPLGREQRDFAKVLASCAPWFVVPRISSSTW